LRKERKAKEVTYSGSIGNLAEGLLDFKKLFGDGLWFGRYF
jgi:hypothetical protein